MTTRRLSVTDGSAWWSDALTDPWRDPTTPTRIVLPPEPEPPTAPPLEPVPPPAPPAGRNLVVLMVSAVLVTGLLAGMTGGALGYLVAQRDGATVIGFDDGGAVAAPAPGSLAEAVAKVLPSVVTVRSEGGARALGSGFVISEDGYLLTNDHVVAAAAGDALSVQFDDGSTADATVVGRDQESDLAVLRVERDDLVPVTLGDSEAVSVGDPVFAVGSPFALTSTVTAGIVSAVDRTLVTGPPGGPVRYYAAIQTDAAVNQGNSGGPLLDAAGRVIGVNSVIKSVAVTAAGAGNIGLAFAIPIRQAVRVAAEIIDTGRASRTVLGVEVDRAGSAGSGVALRSVAPGGPAAQAGLRPGDRLLRLDGRLLERPEDLVALVRKYDPGTTVPIEYRRAGTTATTHAVLAADRN